MRTTLDLPDDLFRDVKTRATQQGTSLKKLITQFILSGLGSAQPNADYQIMRRAAPPVAIRKLPGQLPHPAPTNRELHAILEAEDREAFRDAAVRIKK